jgi:tripartite-type tricarboxylate transporter receptor subunit TctC
LNIDIARFRVPEVKRKSNKHKGIAMRIATKAMRFAARGVTGVAMAAAMLASTSPAQAAGGDDYPTHTITLIVPWPAGGFTDRLGRIMAEKMSATLGKPIVVENRPGASASIGTEQTMRAAPDGYTLVVTSTDGLVKLLQNKGTDPVNGLTQISMLAAQPVTLAVGPKFKGDTLAQFVEEAKKNPGAISYASNGEGGATHLGMEIFARQAGIQLNHIPYKGTAPALNDLLGGQVDATLVSLQGVGSYLPSKRVRALAITSPQRQAAAPEVPTFAESGYPNFDLTLWYGLAAPKGLPPAILQKLNAAAVQALALPDVQQQLRSQAAEPIPGTPAQIQAFMQKEAARWGATLK